MHKIHGRLWYRNATHYCFYFYLLHFVVSVLNIYEYFHLEESMATFWMNFFSLLSRSLLCSFLPIPPATLAILTSSLNPFTHTAHN